MKVLERISRTKRAMAAVYGRLLADLQRPDFRAELGVSPKGGPSSWLQNGQTLSDVVDKAARVRNCAGVLELRTYFEQDAHGCECQKVAVHNADFCGKVLLCQTCAGRAQATRLARFGPAIEAAADRYPFAYFITFTVPPGRWLRESLLRLKRGFRAFHRRGQRRAGRGSPRSAGQWGKVRAALAGLEVKEGAGSGDFHCHYHVLAFTEKPIDFSVYDGRKRRFLERAYGGRGKVPQKCLDRIPRDVISFTRADGQAVTVPVSPLSRDWFAATGETAINVDCRPVVAKPGGKSLVEQCKEILKYPLAFEKGSLVSSDNRIRLVEMIAATFNTRCFERYGDFRKVKLPDLTEPKTAKSQEIFVSFWDTFERSYTPPSPVDGPVFKVQFGPDVSPEKRELLATQARMIGAYRGLRRRILEDATVPRWRESEIKSTNLDHLKEGFREQVRRLWLGFRETPPPRPGWETWVQGVLDLWPDATPTVSPCPA